MKQSTSLFESATVEDMERSASAPLVTESQVEQENVTAAGELDAETLKTLQADQIGSDEVDLPQFTPTDALVHANILSQAQATSLKSAAIKRPDYDLIQDVVDKRIATEEQLLEALSRETGYQQVQLRRDEDVQTAAWHDFDLKLLEEERILPFKRVGNSLSVAVADERGLLAVREFSTFDHATIVPHLAALSQLNSAFHKAREINSKLMKGENASSFAGDVIGFVELLLHASVSDGVSDIHIEPYAKSAMIRRRIDGVMQEWPVSEFLFENFGAVIARVKILAALNISERRLPQDGAITIQHGDAEIDIRVSVLPALFGERVVMRILNKGALDMSIDTLGFGEQELEQLKLAVDAPQGMVLVTGPTGSGKSTTLYSVLNRINKPELNILTAEDPVEYQMLGIGQVQIKDEIGLDFAAVLRSFLRQDPDVVLVGEIRDKETVDISIKAALTGHLLLSTLHTNDAASTISRLVNIGVPPYLIASSLKLVVAQRLARKVCSECGEADHSVGSEELIKIGFTTEEAENITPLRGKGCPLCHGTGYRGRQGIYEVLAVTDAIREVIESEKTTDELLETAKQNGFRTMQEIARDHVASGVISVTEYSRVMLIE